MTKAGSPGEPPDQPRCAMCGSDNLLGVEYEDYTGVEQDGYKERRLWVGYLCRECGWRDEL
jgi:hypothetical protein